MATKINFRPTPRRGAGFESRRMHTLQDCQATGLARFRDHHQARDGVRALKASAPRCEVSSFACPECRGWHVEKTQPITAARPVVAAAPAAAFTASLVDRPRRYFLVDVENVTFGAKRSNKQLAALWQLLVQQAPGIAAHDHVVVGSSRSVAARYRSTLQGPNVKWVVGANAPDAADRALLGAVDLYRVARDFDELVIVSGDHAFAPLARRARAMGLRVQVVTVEHPTSSAMLSRDLSAAADLRTTVRLTTRPKRRQAVDAAAAMSGARQPGLAVVAA